MSDPLTPQEPSRPDPARAAQGEAPVDIAELRAISKLLRRLPDPEPPEDLRERVMERIRSESPVVERARGRLRSQQGVAAALAAGIAGFFLLSSPQAEAPTGLVAQPLAPADDAPSQRSARPMRRAPALRLPLVAASPVEPRTDLAQLARFASDRLPATTAPALPPLERRLDHQIDQMLHQPDAFFRRLERMRENDRYLARLAARSAQRGDSAAVALQVRNSPHPLAPKIAEQFLRASLAQSLGHPRRSGPPSIPSAPGTRRGRSEGQTAPVYAH